MGEIEEMMKRKAQEVRNGMSESRINMNEESRIVEEMCRRVRLNKTDARKILKKLDG